MKKYIILALVALLAAVLFVACDNDVKVDNNTAYTEVLESEGAFVVNGKGYDTLQSAIQAAVGGKTSADPVKITMTRNTSSRPVVIPAGADIRLYLGGHKLTFIDVETSAISVVSDDYDQTTFFLLTNGTVALLENSNDRNVIDVKAIGEEYSLAYVDLSGVTVNGNISVYGGAGGDAELWVDSETEVNGKVKAKGETPLDSEYYPWGDANATLYVKSDLNDVEMTNAYLDVTSSGHVVLTALDGGNYFVATSETSITNETDVAIVVDGGVCYIEREEGVSYYGSLQAALNDLDADNLTIIFRDDYNKSELAVEAGAGRPVIIDLNGYNVTVASITADAALTIVNSNVPNLPAASATFKGNITAAGTFLVNCNVDEDVLAEGKVVINGSVTAGGLGVGAYNAEFTSDIETTGRVEVVGCAISPAAEGFIHIQSSEDISMAYVNFDCSDYNLASVFANKGGNISMINCTGNVGAIVATNVAGSEPGNITIDNSEVSETLYTRVLAAADITVYANSADKVIVYGPVTGAAVTAGSSANTVKKGATFKDDISASESASFYSSTLGVGTSNYIDVFSPEITFYGSELHVGEMLKGYDGLEAIPADSVVIDSTEGYVGAIHTNALNIDASDVYIVVDVVNAAAPVDESGKATVVIDGGQYRSVNLSGKGISNIYSGEFGYYDSLSYGNFTYNGTGTLNVTGGYFNGITKFLRGSSIVLNGSSLYFSDIDAVTDNVHIKSANIDEDSLEDVEKIVNRINQDSVSVEEQRIDINYVPSGIVNLTGVDNVFNMTSANIQSEDSAILNFTMYETDVYDTDDVVTSGLIVGSKDDSTPASATFNYNNGSGKYQLNVTGKIGLLAGGNVIYTTQLNDDHTERPNNNLVYGCTYELVDDNEGTDDDVYGYVIRDDVYGVASMAGYYEYRYNGN